MLKRATLALVAGVAAGVLAAPAARADHVRDGGPSLSAAAIARRDGCERTTTSVRLTAADPGSYRVAGWLCGPRDPRGGEVQFLLPGFSYNHLYWMGLGIDRLDYIRATTRQGRTTFVIDELGSGASDHPDPDQVTFTNLAYTVHQLVGELRSGGIGRAHTRFRRVIGAGHSMGAGVWMVEAGTYGDVNAVMLADFLHVTDPDFVNELRAHYIAAATQSRFATLPAGYLTVLPRSLFYDTGLVNPSVLQRDEEIGMDTGTTGLTTTLALARDPKYSQAIAVPVLLVTGREDALGCNEVTPGLSCATSQAVLDRELPDYSSAPRVDAFVFDSGHDTNLHNAAPEWFAYANRWLNSVGRTGR
ncbi:alpha/beta hydrolase [Actinomadura sp. DC4]|uniref:alpha/beta hydrolase n=1 Tax=Actinomadura sp. DC4 TaxID=3055069 RepID=UPI0025B20B02|nr:alpha/beta hydrolase [Actinomadura sp. DC4]MDN3352299.1 alpha/beta hydrolase [Actinomadura sp. DC4]